MIQVDSISRSYGNFVAVDGVSFTISPGEIVGLLGHNGEQISYTFAALPDDDSAFALRVSNRSNFFKVYGWLVNDLQSYDRQKLTTPADLTDTPSADEDTATAPDPQQQ